MQWIGAGDGINMNYRWSQTKRTERNRQEKLYLEGLFPRSTPGIPFMAFVNPFRV
jgi:hypothetical protein